MSLDLAAQEERIQSLADILSLVAIIGSMEKAAVQRVLVSLGSSLLDMRSALAVDREMASRLLVQVARESGEKAAIELASDLTFVANAWRPVLDDGLLRNVDPHRSLPYAELVYRLAIHSSSLLHEYGAFQQFGGRDVVLPMAQLTSALRIHSIPRMSLEWDLVGFQDPPDQALVAHDDTTFFLMKSAPAPTTLRISELERGSDDEARQEHDIEFGPPLFAAFTAGLLGDLLYWAARLRHHADPGREMWERIQALLIPSAVPPEPRRPEPPPPHMMPPPPPDENIGEDPDDLP